MSNEVIAGIEAQVVFAQKIVTELLRQTYRGMPEQAVMLHELQRIQGHLALALKLFREQLGPESMQGPSRSSRLPRQPPETS